MIASKRVKVAHDDARITMDITFSDSYEAVVLYEHVVDCLRRGIEFQINFDASKARKLPHRA